MRTAPRVETSLRVPTPEYSRLVPIYPYLAACEPGRVPSNTLPLLSAHSNANFDSDDTRTALYILAETPFLSNVSTLQKSPFPSRHPSADLSLANDNEDSNEDLAFAPAAPSTCKCTSKLDDGDDDGGVCGGAGNDRFNTVDVVPGGNGPLASRARKGGCY